MTTMPSSRLAAPRRARGAGRHAGGVPRAPLPSANRERATTFTTLEFRPGSTRAVVIERDRQNLPGRRAGRGYRLMVDLFVEFGDRARAATWQLDIRKIDDVEWRIADQERFSAVDNLYKLSVNPEQQFDARDFKVRAEDLELTLVEGSVFRVDTDQGVTGPRADRPRRDAVQPDAGDREGTGPDLRGRRDARVAVRRRVHSRRRHERARRHVAARRPAGRSARPAPRGADLPRGVGQVVRPRTGRHVARGVVAAAGRRRLPRRNAHTPLRHADLRALPVGGRRHLALRSPAPAQHLRVCVGRQAGVARAASTTRTTSRRTTCSTTTST